MLAVIEGLGNKTSETSPCVGTIVRGLQALELCGAITPTRTDACWPQHVTPYMWLRLSISVLF